MPQTPNFTCFWLALRWGRAANPKFAELQEVGLIVQPATHVFNNFEAPRKHETRTLHNFAALCFFTFLKSEGLKRVFSRTDVRFK